MWIGRAVIGYCENDNESSESVKCGELDSVNCYVVLKKNSFPWG
jgi:hypothetical protein